MTDIQVQTDQLLKLISQGAEAASKNDLLAFSAAIQKIIAASKGVSQKLHFDPEFIEAFHQVALHHYNSGHYDTASEFLLFLLQLNMHSYDYAYQLAAAKQALGDYEAALLYYDVAAQNNPLSPFPHFYAGETLFALERYKKEAKKRYEQALELGGKTEGFSPLKTQIKQRLLLL